jgi:hypothetical protein
VLALFTVTAYPTNLTWWAFLLAVVISFGFSLPVGIIQAVTANQIGLNVLTEFVYGYIQPGRPLALMMYVYVLYFVQSINIRANTNVSNSFKTFGYITM